MPHEGTATTPAVRAAATMASTALPPEASTSLPNVTASGWPVTQPLTAVDASPAQVGSRAPRRPPSSAPPTFSASRRSCLSPMILPCVVVGGGKYPRSIACPGPRDKRPKHECESRKHERRKHEKAED